MKYLNKLRALVRLAGFLPFALAACGAPTVSDDGNTADDRTLAETTQRAQMNDVTVIYPLPTSQADFAAMLPASAAGLGGELLPKALYLSTFGYPADPPSGPQPVGGGPSLPYSMMRLLAVRIDPCFAQIGPVTDPTTCQNQLRLVFQALAFADGHASAVDGAVHAFYSLSRVELKAVLEAVIAARQKSGGDAHMGALAVHPLLAAQGLGGDFASALQVIVLAHAGSQNLVRMTTFLQSNLDTVWTFRGFDITSSGAPPMIIPTLPDSAASVKFFQGFGAHFAGGFTPATTATDDMQLLGNAASAQSANATAQQAALDAAFAIENPDRHSPNTIDCASCHMANPAKVATAQQVLGLSLTGNANAFVADSAFVSAADLAETAPFDSTKALNLHMLSYNGDNLVIAPRVINETANVVSAVNQTVLH